MWKINDLPTERSGRGRDYIGWLQCGDIHVKICISDRGITDEHARLIVQHFAGMISADGLMEGLPKAVLAP